MLMQGGLVERQGGAFISIKKCLKFEVGLGVFGGFANSEIFWYGML